MASDTEQESRIKQANAALELDSLVVKLNQESRLSVSDILKILAKKTSQVAELIR